MKNTSTKANKIKLKAAVCCTVFAPILWFLWLFCDYGFVSYRSFFYPFFKFIYWIIAAGSGITMICAIGLWITILIQKIRQKQNKKIPSGFLCFAIADIILMIGAAAFAAYDLLRPAQIGFDGMAGTILLIFVIPIMLLILVLDCVIAYICKRKKQSF